MQSIAETLQRFPQMEVKPEKVKKVSDRAVLLMKIAELTGMEEVLNKQYWSFAGKFNHLKGEEGLKILNWMYETAMTEDKQWRAFKFWTLLKKTKC